MSDIPEENLLKRKKVGKDKKCCFGNCRSDSRNTSGTQNVLNILFHLQNPVLNFERMKFQTTR